MHDLHLHIQPLRIYIVIRLCEVVNTQMFISCGIIGVDMRNDVLDELLIKRGLTRADVSKATGISQSSFHDWKIGRSKPKKDKVKLIADFLGVTVDFLETGEEKEGYYLNEETAKKAQELFENPSMRMLFSAARDASPEDLELAAQMLMRLKKKDHYEGFDD